MSKKRLSLLTITATILVAALLYISFTEESVTEDSDKINNASINKPSPKQTSRDAIILKTPDFFNIKPVDSIAHNTTANVGQPVRLNLLPGDTVSILSNIENLLSAGTPSEQLDQALIELLENPNISRLDKIYPLWNLIIKTGLDTENGNYVLEYLSALQPIELTEDMINAFNSGVSDKTKGLLLDILQASAGIANPEQQTEEQLNFIGMQSERIQNFFLDQIYTSDNDKIFKKAFMIYPSIVPTEQAISVITDIIKNKDHKKLDLSESEIVSLSAQVALSTYEAQSALLPGLLESFSRGNNSLESQASFNDNLYSALNSTDTSFLADNIKPQVSSYIRTQEPPLSSASPVEFENLSSYYAWAKAYVATSNTDPVTRNQALAVTAIESSDPTKASAVILLSEPDVIQYIKQSGSYAELKKSMESALTNTSISEDSKRIVSDALEQLK